MKTKMQALQIIPKTFKGALSWYKYKLLTRPWITQCITAGTLGSIGDIFSQKIVEKHPINWKRNAQLCFVGFTFYGPHGHWFYQRFNPWYLR